MNSNNDIVAPFSNRAGTSQALYDGEPLSYSPSFQELELAKLYPHEVSFSKNGGVGVAVAVAAAVAVAVIVAIALEIVAAYE